MLNDISNIILKINIELGILDDRNLSYTMRVGVEIPSLFTEMRLKSLIGILHS